MKLCYRVVHCRADVFDFFLMWVLFFNLINNGTAMAVLAAPLPAALQGCRHIRTSSSWFVVSLLCKRWRAGATEHILVGRHCWCVSAVCFVDHRWFSRQRCDLRWALKWSAPCVGPVASEAVSAWGLGAIQCHRLQSYQQIQHHPWGFRRTQVQCRWLVLPLGRELTGQGGILLAPVVGVGRSRGRCSCRGGVPRRSTILYGMHNSEIGL